MYIYIYVYIYIYIYVYIYIYIIYSKATAVYLACSSRPPGNRCPATVISNTHIHAVKVYAAIRMKAKDDIFVFWSRVAQDVVSVEVTPTQPVDSVSHFQTLVGR